MRPALMEARCNDVIRVGEWNAAHSETFYGVSVVRLRHEVFYDAFDGLIIAACPGRPGAQIASKSPEQSDYRPHCRYPRISRSLGVRHHAQDYSSWWLAP